MARAIRSFDADAGERPGGLPALLMRRDATPHSVVDEPKARRQPGIKGSGRVVKIGCLVPGIEWPEATQKADSDVNVGRPLRSPGRDGCFSGGEKRLATHFGRERMGKQGRKLGFKAKGTRNGKEHDLPLVR